LLELGVDSKGNFVLILPNIEAYDNFIRIIIFLRIDHTLDIHRKPINPKISSDNID
jgi:hypothetical protein